MCLWSVHNCRPTCVCERNMTRVPFGEQRARPTEPSGVRRERDGRVVYSVHVYRHFLDALLHGAGVIHGYKISILYTI